MTTNNETPETVYLDTNLKHLRGMLGRSQEEVAVSMGVKRSSYSGYENGFAEPNASLLCRMALYHRVTLDMLLMEDLRKWKVYDLEVEQRRIGALRPVPVFADAAKPKARLIHERQPREMNARMKSRAPKQPEPPKKQVMPELDGTVQLRIDGKTVVHVKPGYALERWMERYPQAVRL
jgi:transcriptional regulator with XRE-family HTH domain